MRFESQFLESKFETQMNFFCLLWLEKIFQKRRVTIIKNRNSRMSSRYSSHFSSRNSRCEEKIIADKVIINNLSCLLKFVWIKINYSENNYSARTSTYQSTCTSSETSACSSNITSRFFMKINRQEGLKTLKLLFANFFLEFSGFFTRDYFGIWSRSPGFRDFLDFALGFFRDF